MKLHNSDFFLRFELGHEFNSSGFSPKRGLQLADLSGLPIRGHFLAENHLNSCPNSNLKKTQRCGFHEIIASTATTIN